MQLTVGDILGLEVLRAALPEVVGGGSLDRVVRWVHVSDVADLADLLQGGELVLTTGAPMAEAATRSRYLRGLADAGVVGLIVELGTHLDAIPGDLIAQADSLALPVIALHRQIRFVEVTEQVHRSIVADQYDEVAFARHAHEVFTDLSMDRASLTAIVEAVAALIDAPVVLEDLTRQVLAFAAHDQPTSELLDAWERRSRLTPMSDHTGVDGPDHWLTTPVGPHRQQWGRLVVPRPPDSATRASMAIERAAQALALNRMVEQDRTTLEQQAQSGLIDDLRRGRIHLDAEATARAQALGLRPAAQYLPMTVRVDGHTGSDQVVAQRHQVSMLDAVRHAVHVSRQSALTASREPGQIDLLLSHTHIGSPDASVAPLCTAIRAALLRIDGVSRCAIGVATGASRLLDAAQGLDDSAHVADVALSLPPDHKPFHRATDVRLRGLLAVIRTDPRVQAFAETELRALLDHHARHGDDSIDVLRSFLETGGNKTELAKRLHLSRPTLYAKLATIQRILDVDLDDAESRTSLHTALLILDTPAPA